MKAREEASCACRGLSALRLPTQAAEGHAGCSAAFEEPCHNESDGICTYIYIYKHIYICVNTTICIHLHAYLCVYMYIHAYTHTYIHTTTLKCMCAYIYICTLCLLNKAYRKEGTGHRLTEFSTPSNLFGRISGGGVRQELRSAAEAPPLGREASSLSHRMRCRDCLGWEGRTKHGRSALCRKDSTTAPTALLQKAQ